MCVSCVCVYLICCFITIVNKQHMPKWLIVPALGSTAQLNQCCIVYACALSLAIGLVILPQWPCTLSPWMSWISQCQSSPRHRCIWLTVLWFKCFVGNHHARSDVVVGKRQHLKQLAKIDVSCDFHGTDGGAYNACYSLPQKEQGD